jgi:hypothetical protein
MTVELNAAESLLARCMTEGRECNLTDAAGDGRLLRGETLRQLLFGLPVRLAGADADTRHSWPISGVRIRGALIEADRERINLADLATAEGGALPPLILLDCVIGRPLRLSGARLRRLSLEGCAISFLEATGLMVEGDVVLNGLRSNETEVLTGCQGQPLCRVDFKGARIGGGLFAKQARLAAPPARPESEVLRADGAGRRLALDLLDSHIGNALNLSPGFKAFGGVRISEVGGDVDLDCAELTDEEDDALSGQIAVIGGALFLRSLRLEGETFPASVKGSVTLSGARIGDDLDLTGTSIEGDLNLSGIQIGGCCRLRSRAWSAPGALARLTVTGDVTLTNARITQDLYLSGISIGEDLSLASVTVGKDAFLADIGRELAPGMFGPPLWVPLQVTGSIVLRGAVVQGELDMRCLRLAGPLHGVSVTVGTHWWLGGTDAGGPESLLQRGAFLVGSRVGGNLFIDLETHDDLVLAQVTVAELLKLNLRGKRGADKGRRRPELVLDSASVGGLSDDHGRAVADFRLSMAGFSYRLLHDAERPATGKGTAVQAVRLLRTPIASALLTFLLVAGVAGAVLLESLNRPGWHWALAVAGVALLGWGLRSLQTTRAPSDYRLAWLARQEAPKTRPSFKPEPYERLSRYYRSQGQYDEARRVARRKLDLERRLRAPIMLRPLFWMYAKLFDHGMGPERAVVVFFACIVVGTGGVSIAANGLDLVVDPGRLHDRLGGIAPIQIRARPVLVIDAAAVQPASRGQKPSFLDAPAGTSDDLQCGDAVEPSIYALDAFIPALDLKHERRCSVSGTPEAVGWRFAFAAYSILGWIITSLTVLTLSGILRRRAEGA